MSRYSARVTSTLALALAATAAPGQTFNWDNSSGGSWFAPTNWSPTGIPNGASSNAVLDLGGSYAAVIDSGNVSLDALSLTHPGARIDIANGRVLSVAGGIMNQGEIVINSSGGGSATHLQLADSLAITGTGSVRLNATSNSLDRAYLWYSNPAHVLTNGPMHTIHGTGNLYVQIDNQGLVSADVDGGILQLHSQPKSNSGVMEAVDGGELLISGITIDQTGGGIIDAPDVGGVPGLITLNGASIIGGSIREQDTSPIRAIGGVHVNNTGITGRLNLTNGAALQVDGDELLFDGSITVNSSGGGNATHIQFNQPATTLGAPGSEVILNATNNGLDRAYLWYGNPANVVTNVQGHTIRGSGNLYVSLMNEGLLSADVDGGLLRLGSTPKGNSGTMQATGGGVLLIDGVAVNQTVSGTILAPDGGATPNEIRLQGATINAGVVEAQGSSTIEIAGPSAVNNTDIRGHVNVQNARVLTVLGDQLNHDGTITVNSSGGGNATHIQFNQPFTTLGPSGAEVVLNATSNSLDRAYLWYSNAANVVHNVQGHTIRGSGNIYTSIVNDGLISADRDGAILRLANTPKINDNTIQAVNGATVLVQGVTVDQTGGGQVTATPAGGAPAAIDFSGATILGGDVSATGGSRTTLGQSSTFDNVDFEGPVDIPNQRVMTLTGDETTFDGPVAVNSNGGGSATHIVIAAAQHEINGTGPIILNATSNSLDRAYFWYSNAANVLTLKTPVQGSGNVYTSLVNESTITANQGGLVLRLASQPKTNRGVMSAEGGGILAVSGVTLTQETGGQLVATGGSTINLDGAIVVGGPINASDGVVNVPTNSTLTNVELSGPLNLFNSRVLTITESLINNGTILINSNTGGSATYMSRSGGPVAIDGDGEIVLNATSGVLDRAYLWYGNVANDVLTTGPEQTLAGHGNMYGHFVVRGTLAPGHAQAAAGEIGLIGINSGSVELEPTATVEFQITGNQPAEYDHFAGNSSFECAGTIRAEVSGWMPGSCEVLTLINAAGGVSGRFDTEILPADPEPGKNWRLFYTSSSVELRLTCYPDFDGSCTLDIFDFLAFQDAFVNMDPEADCDQNTMFDVFDFLCFQDAFVTGCN
jgi:hypothetical protein